MKYLLVFILAISCNVFSQDKIATPGALNLAVTQANIHTTICVPGWTKTVRPSTYYTNSLKKKQLSGTASGGVYKSDLPMTAFEEDHRVPLALGGSPKDPKNLWPQPWTGQAGNAKNKDVIETSLHRSVCSGRLTLQQGREVFLGDYSKWWIEHKSRA